MRFAKALFVPRTACELTGQGRDVTSGASQNDNRADAGLTGLFLPARLFHPAPDGRMDFEMPLSFAPQTPYLIGLMVSAIMYAACIAVSAVGFFVARRRERAHA